jgi:mannitol-specific phosphotransferase system IIBC component
MNQSAKNVYWKVCYETYCAAYFQELAAEALTSRWQKIDFVTAFLVSTTASGSTIAGLALWTQPGWKIVWAIIAVVAMVTSIVHSILGVPSRLKTQEEFRRSFSELRVALETFRQKLTTGIDVNEAKSKYDELRNKYEHHMGRANPDFAYRKRLRHKIQEQVNKINKEKGYIK